LKKIGKSFKTS